MVLMLAITSCGKIGSGPMGRNPILENYDQEELSQRIKSLKTPAEGSGHVPLVLLQYSDIHGDHENASRMMKFYSVFSSDIDDVLSCGDNLANDYDNDYSWWRKVTGSDKVLLSIGNHDSASYVEGVGYSWTAHAGEDCYEKFIAPSCSQWGVTLNASSTYYYKDYHDSGVRLVVLDCMSYDASQEEWFSHVMTDAEDRSLAVVALSHYPVSAFTPIDCAYSTRQDLEAGTIKEYWSHKPALGGAVAIVDKFIDKGGEFVCWLGGHLHKNAVGYLPKHHGQLILLTESASLNPDITRQGDSERKRGTKSQDSFNIIGIDPARHCLNVMKIGAEEDKEGRSRKFLSIDYHSREILETY